MASTTGLELAKNHVKSFFKVKGIKLDPTEALDHALDMGRSYLTNRFPWTFSRFRETKTLNATEAANGYFVPSNEWSGELIILQSSPTDNKGEVVYTSPEHWEKKLSLNSSTDANSQFYTVYNEREIWIWPPPPANNQYIVVGQWHMIDANRALPLRFGAALGSLTLFFLGAPPPNDRVTWMQAAEAQIRNLVDRDRPPSREKRLVLPAEDVAFFLENE